jgi:PII-like signaling protein
MIQGKGKLLRIFVGESNKHDGVPLYEWIINMAKEAKMAGATVIRGMEGFGVNSHIHTSKILRLSQNLPIIVEIVDDEKKICEFLETINPHIKKGLATLETVEIVFSKFGTGEEE